MMEVAPAAVAATIASIIDFVPFEKLSNSNTPGGLSTSTDIQLTVTYELKSQRWQMPARHSTRTSENSVTLSIGPR